MRKLKEPIPAKLVIEIWYADQSEVKIIDTEFKIQPRPPLHAHPKIGRMVVILLKDLTIRAGIMVGLGTLGLAGVVVAKGVKGRGK